MEIAILLYDNFTALDAVGPYEVLSRLPDARIKFVATVPGPIRSDTRALAMMADYPLIQVPRPDLLLIPGGPGDEATAADATVLDWVRTAHENTKWTASVCTGSLILAAAGVLAGVEATTHWCRYDRGTNRSGRRLRARDSARNRVRPPATLRRGLSRESTAARRADGTRCLCPWPGGTPESLIPARSRLQSRSGKFRPTLGVAAGTAR
jgi:putative intracellular protease/amidase